MGCIYSHDGECDFFNINDTENRPQGCDEEGNCSVDEDPSPSDSCDMYESDSQCFNCGADFNADEECTC